MERLKRGLETEGLGERFLGSAEQRPEALALNVGGQCWSYGQFAQHALQLGRQFERSSEPLVGVLAQRSATAYAGVLGALLSGRGYVPLNPRFPHSRTVSMIRRAGISTIVVGRNHLSSLHEILEDIPHSTTVICPEPVTPEGDPGLDGELVDRELVERFPHHRFCFHEEFAAAAPLSEPRPLRSDIAYLMFTSGSTGEPKGIAVTHDNVDAYVDTIHRRYRVRSSDRFSQMFDLTFDLSVHDMFVSWFAGASLHVPAAAALMAPAKFIEENELTMWFSVPSVIGTMKTFGMLTPGRFPSLRHSLFCGEPLTVEAASAWAAAAPNGPVDNLYGPTEATIAITGYRFRDRLKGARGLVPIGTPFPGQEAVVIGPDLRPVSNGDAGELCVAGSQITSGYWNAPKLTRERFVELSAFPGRRWYRTGDLVARDPDGTLHFRGRLDDQVKVRGHRVELQEVEHVLRRASGCADVVSIAWPQRNGTAEGIVGFVRTNDDDSKTDPKALRAACREFLPDYMVPKKIVPIADWPLNANGKVDRARLKGLLQEGR